MLNDSHFGFGRGLGGCRGVGVLARVRRRKYYLALARDRALFDLPAGTQLSIQWVLRASKTQSEGA